MYLVLWVYRIVYIPLIWAEVAPFRFLPEFTVKYPNPRALSSLVTASAPTVTHPQLYIGIRGFGLFAVSTPLPLQLPIRDGLNSKN
jgi:predicted component of type VI protein secretion system